MSAKRTPSSNRNKILNIVVTGYQKIKEPRNHHVFIMDVTWNNGERYEIYRRYSDFFSFHTTLKAMVQATSERGNKEITIPQFPKRNFVWRSQAARVTEAKVDQFNRYCQAIISLDPCISESVHVKGFFTPRGGDRKLPTVKFRNPPQLLKSGSSNKQPILPKIPLEEYRALADFEAEDSSQASFKRGDQVFVRSKDESGWWLCEVKGKLGWAPPTFLKKYKDNSEIERSDDSSGYIILSYPSVNKRSRDDKGTGDDDNYEDVPFTSESGIEEGDPEVTAEEYKAIENYEADGPGQVSFKEGDIIHVQDKLEDGWWFVNVGENEGWAPCSYMETLNGQEEEEEITFIGSEKYYSVEAYVADESDEISFPRHAIMEVLQKRLDGWWLVKYKDTKGLAPGTYLRKGVPPDEPTFTFTSEPDPHSVSESKRDMKQAYENVQLQMAKPQPPRRVSVRHWVAEKRRQKPKQSQARSPQTESQARRQPQFGSATNSQRNLLTVSPNGFSNAEKGRTLGAIRELKEDDTHKQEKVQQQRSLRFAQQRELVGRKNSYDKGGDGIRVQATKPPVAAPRTRIRNVQSVETPGPEVSKQSRPKIKERSKSADTPSLVYSVPTTPARALNRSPPVITARDRIPTVNDEPEDFEESPSLVYDHPRPLRRSDHELEEDEPPPLGPGHPLRDDGERPQLPPRPTPSVYKRAKENASRPEPVDYASFDDVKSVSGLSTSSWSHSSQEKSHRKIKKSRSQTPADERFQAARLYASRSPVSRQRSIGNTTDDDLYSAVQPVAGGATRGEENPYSEEMLGTMIKYILSSPDPSLKESFKNLFTNNEALKTCLQ